MQTPVATLEYAPPVPWHRRRRWRRWVIFVLSALTIAITGWVAVPRIMQQWQYVRGLSRALNYAAPPDQIIYEEDATSAAQLLASDPIAYHRLIYPGTIAGTDWNAVARYIPPWSDTAWPAPFLHGLRDSKGRTRLVEVYARVRNAEELGRGRVLLFTASVLELPSLRPGSRANVLFDRSPLALPNLEPGDRVRMYAGQVDPKDPSRFTIAYLLNGEPGMIYGKLNDDGSLTMEAPNWTK